MIYTIEENNFELNEAFISYFKPLAQTGNPRTKSKTSTHHNFFTNKMLIVKTIRSGIPYSLFAKIKNLSPFTDSDWASFLDISTKSLQRYKKDNTFVFKPIHSEKIIELAEVTNLGTTIFDTSEQFYSWLNTTSLALGNLKPIELLNNSYGKEIVLNELNRIEHGIFV